MVARSNNDPYGVIRTPRLQRIRSPLALACLISLMFVVLGFSDVFKYLVCGLAIGIAMWALVSSRPLALLPHMVLLSQFDTPFMYLHTGLGLRIWYVPFAAIAFRYVLRYPFKVRFLVLLPVIFMPALIASTGSGWLFFAKWCVFYICPILMIISGAGISLRSKPFAFLIEYIVPAAVLIGIMGLTQIFSNLLGGAGAGYYPPSDGWDIRPWGPYSETTWFGEFFVLAFALTTTAMLSKVRGIKRSSWLYKCLLAMEFVLAAASVSRNIVVGFGVLGMLRPRFGFLLAGLGAAALVVLALSGALEGRMSFSGSSSQGGMGRMEAFKMEVRNLTLAPKGFDWDDSESTDEGNAIGSRSFNSVLFLMNSCGAAYGLLLLAAAFIILAHHIVTSQTGSVAPLAIFFSMSMFAPLHFYPAFGVLLGVVMSHFLEPWNRKSRE
jgi:hypothetical protein